MVNAGIEYDLPVPGMNHLVHALTSRSPSKVVYLTSREEHHRDVTEAWLKEHGFPARDVIMRPNDCWASTAEFKEIAIAALKGSEKTWDVVLIDDDEHGVLETMCKRNGYTFLKARSGGQK